MMVKRGAIALGTDGGGGNGVFTTKQPTEPTQLQIYRANRKSWGHARVPFWRYAMFGLDGGVPKQQSSIRFGGQ